MFDSTKAEIVRQTYVKQRQTILESLRQWIRTKEDLPTAPKLPIAGNSELGKHLREPDE